MRYSVEKEVFELDPQLRFGILVGRGLVNTGSKTSDTERLRTAEGKARSMIQAENLKSHPVVHGYRYTMEKAGINPNKYPPSTEAMLKRVLKGGALPEINALVDLCNAVSIEQQISLGGHDLRDIHEDLYVGFTKGGEKFLPFGASEYEPVEAGELVFASGAVVQTRKWVWRQSELGKMDLDTKDVFFQLVGFDENEDGPLMQAIKSLEVLITERFGGQFQRFVVKRDNPVIEF